jgi:hypothetical protein
MERSMNGLKTRTLALVRQSSYLLQLLVGANVVLNERTKGQEEGGGLTVILEGVVKRISADSRLDRGREGARGPIGEKLHGKEVNQDITRGMNGIYPQDKDHDRHDDQHNEASGLADNVMTPHASIEENGLTSRSDLSP